jgi:hypothetical protein
MGTSELHPHFVIVLLPKLEADTKEGAKEILLLGVH